MRVALCIFGFEVLAVEVDGYEEDVDLAEYAVSSETERADYGAWREEHDEDAEPRPRIIAAGAHRARRRRAPVIAIGTKHRNGPVDVNPKTKGTNGFGFGSSIR